MEFIIVVTALFILILVPGLGCDNRGPVIREAVQERRAALDELH